MAPWSPKPLGARTKLSHSPSSRAKYLLCQMGWKENEVKDLQLLQINHEEMVKFLPGLCLMFAFEPHLEDTLERSTFLFWICT